MNPTLKKLVGGIRYFLAECILQIYGLILLFSLVVVWSTYRSILIVTLVGLFGVIAAVALYSFINSGGKK